MLGSAVSLLASLAKAIPCAFSWHPVLGTKICSTPRASQIFCDGFFFVASSWFFPCALSYLLITLKLIFSDLILNLTLPLCFSPLQYCCSECLKVCGSAFNFPLLPQHIFHLWHLVFGYNFL